MGDLLGSVPEQLKQLWQGLSHNQRLGIIFVLALSIMVLGVSLVWATQPDYAIAYANLSQQDAAAVVAKLKELGIPYQISGSGTTVLVPSSKLYEARLQLASEGLPQGGGIGFEVFDRTSFGATDFTQKVNYRRALEGELARTIAGLGPVERARVHLALPEPRLYKEDQQPATASVVLMMRSGSRLSATQTRGITHLVACSVEGLKPENITVVDTNGNMLSDGFAAGAGAADYKLSANQIEFTQAYERNLAAGVEAMLTKVLGPNKVAISVKAELDWQKIETESETYAPTKGQEPLLSSHEVTEQSQEPGAGPGGVPGTQSNVTGSPPNTTPSGNSSYQRREITTNYETGRTIQRSATTPGTLKRLSVAVVVDGPENEAQAQNIKNIVSAALGLDTSRGDALTVTNMPFDKSYYEAEQKAMEAAEQQELYRKPAMVGGGILGLAIIFFFLRRFRGAASRPRQPALAPSMPPQPFIAPKQRSKEALEQEFLRQELAKAARTEPKALADLVEAWLKEE